MIRHRNHRTSVLQGGEDVSGVNTAAGDGEQPAYWDGHSWWLIGWECPVAPGAITALRAIQ